MGALLAAGEIIDLTTQQAEQQGEDQDEQFAVGDEVKVARPGFEEHVFKIARLDPRRRIRFILQSLKPGFDRFELKASAKDLTKVAA